MRSTVSIFGIVWSSLSILACISSAFQLKKLSHTNELSSSFCNIYQKHTNRLNSNRSNRRLIYCFKLSNSDNNDVNSELSDTIEKLSVDEILSRLQSIKKSDEIALVNTNNKEKLNDLEDALNRKLQSDQPPDWMIRLNLLGFTPFTYGGFLLAFIIIILNNTLGTGWASRLMGIADIDNSPISIQTEGLVNSGRFRNLPPIDLNDLNVPIKIERDSDGHMIPPALPKADTVK